MRRVAIITAVLAAAAGVAILGTGAGDSSGYQVRAIFDNADFVIPGEDVKIAGVKVGSVDSLEVTKQKKAAIVLNITQSGFQDFRADAHCSIRPQSLIGEKFVECTPTAPHPPGSGIPPKLPAIKSGDGKGQHYLPVQNTSSPVDPDQINSILRQPNATRLALILNEFGTGLAGNGKALSETIHRANPALQSLDKVLAILANQNKVLADLARDSDTVLAPLSAQRQRVADFVVKANTVNQATAERSAALRANLQLLPRFLQELRPTMNRLGGLADEMTPVLQDLHAQAPAINRLIIQLGPFSQAGRPAIRSLGQASEVGIPAVKAFTPIVNQLNEFTRAAKPVASNLSAILKSVQQTGGVERLMDYIFFQVAAINGFDSFGHYLRAALLVNLCSSYATTATPGCSANFQKQTEAASANAATATKSQKEAALAGAGDDPILQRTVRALAGEKPQEILADEAQAKLEAQTASQERERQAAAARKAEQAKARAAKVKAAARRATLRARAVCRGADTPEKKATCVRARRHARKLANRSTELDRDTFVSKGPIQMPTVELPGGIGAGTPAPQPAQPAGSDGSATAPPAAASAAQNQPQEGGAPSDPQQTVFNYLLGN